MADFDVVTDELSDEQIDAMLENMTIKGQNKAVAKKSLGVKIQRDFFTEVMAMCINGDDYNFVAEKMKLSLAEVESLARKFRRKGFRFLPVPQSGDYVVDDDLSELVGEFADTVELEG